ncbi:MAG TPA: hypothetical protein VMW32_03890 [Bacteroidales bacterium]|nr:hypothetical protein [Bacteroidales bacterium]
MKPDAYIAKVHRITFRLTAILVLMALCNITFPQDHIRQDTFQRIPGKKLVYINDTIRLAIHDTLAGYPSSLIPHSLSITDKTLVFMDSLKIKASRKLITKRLYDLVVIKPGPTDKKRFIGTSDLNYLDYSGKKIRNINIQRLNVFGTNINNPSAYNLTKIENLFNKTHFNTNESIIRKNLLFSEGDTVSPLILSENERIIRQLPYIDDARILIVPVSEEEADIIILTKDVYSLVAGLNFSGIEKGSVSVTEKNIFGMGHEFGIEVPFDAEYSDSPGFGVKYNVNNLRRTFINLKIFYFDGLGKKTFGFDMNRKLISATTKYAGGISIREMITSEDLDSLPEPEPLKYILQDYWLSRSFLINEASASRIIIGTRFTNNNVFDRPFILPDSYHNLQRYRLFLGSVALSIQKYYKTSLIYSYGRNEDVPEGGLFRITAGKEINEFKKRSYFGLDFSIGESARSLGYFYAAAGVASYVNGNQIEQGRLSLRINYFSNLLYIRSNKIRNFVKMEYVRGFARYTDEYLTYTSGNGFSGFRNDSVNGAQRLSLSLESVLFSPINFYGFRFAFFGFADLAFLAAPNQFIENGSLLTGVGLGLRIRNDNLIFNTFQFRLSFFPNLPAYSAINRFTVSGEQLLRPDNFDPGPPSILPYR